MMNQDKLVFHENGEFVVAMPPWMNPRIKPAPVREWDSKDRVWRVPATKANARFLKNEFSEGEISSGAANAIDSLLNVAVPGELFPGWFPFKNSPMAHQSKALDKMWPLREGALFMMMRTGKTFVVINLAAARAMLGQINGLLAICPTSIKAVWRVEFGKHCPIPYDVHVLEAGGHKAAEQWMFDESIEGLKVMVVGVEALSQGKAFDTAMKFVRTHSVMMAVDESSRIKKWKATRTKKCAVLGKHAHYRYLMTGTPITQGIHDLYAQFRFLNWEIIGVKSQFIFENRYCIKGGFDGKRIVGYTRVGELLDAVRPYVYQVRTEDVIGLPPVIEQTRMVKPTKEQKRAMDELGDPLLMATEQNDNVLEIETVLERMTRHQQIVGGLFPYATDDGGYDVEPINGKNPKVEELKATLDELPKDRKVIIWARFRPEIEFICDALTQAGIKHVQYHGGIKSTDEKQAIVESFQNDPDVTAFVANQQSAGMGLELAAASVHIFYSNSFSYEDRKQATFRTSSNQQKADSVLCIDILMDAPIDHRIEASILKKESMADYVRRALG